MESFKPVSNGAVTWDGVNDVSPSAKNFVLCEGWLGDNVKWLLYDNEKDFATLESRYLWFLAVYTVADGGTTTATFWGGKPIPGSGLTGPNRAGLCDEKTAALQFKPTESPIIDEKKTRSRVIPAAIIGGLVLLGGIFLFTRKRRK
jgi:LPXTG-motif cell wall-anchored protein